MATRSRAVSPALPEDKAEGANSLCCLSIGRRGGGLDADTSLTLGGPDADASFALPRVPNSVNPRVVLGVDEDAPMRQIRERFMHIARKCHPDTVPPAHAREAARVYSVALDAFMQLTERARGAG